MNTYFPKKRFQMGFALSSVFALIISGCVATLPATDQMAADESPEKEDKVAWSYDGDDGPEEWGGLSGDFAACGEGVEQSPIDLTAANDADLTDIVFNYGASDLTVLNNGHTIQANYDSGSSIELDGEAFDLLQFHMHAESEHTLDGEYFPLEIHLVHQSDSGQLAVVGLMVEEGDENEALASLWDNLPAEPVDAMGIDGEMINAADLLPADQSSFRYMGSLTTPPCSEEVRWHVLTSPITMSADQIDAFTDIYDVNNRPIQPLNERELLLDQASN